MRDRAKKGCVSDSSLLLASNPFNHRSFAAELIECTRSTTMALSFRILVSISIFPFPNNSDNVLFRKRAVSKQRNASCIAPS